MTLVTITAPFSAFRDHWIRVGLPGTPEPIDANTAAVAVPSWGLRIVYDLDMATRILAARADGEASTEEGELAICEAFGAAGAAVESMDLEV